MEPLWGVGRIGISRFRYLRPTFDECAVLQAIIVWENSEFFNFKIGKKE